LTTKQFLEMQEKLLSTLPGFALGKRLIYSQCPKYVLRGLSFQGSSFNKKSFYVTVFAMALYVPSEHLAFVICKRLRDQNGGERWNFETSKVVELLGSAIRAQAVPLLARVSSLQGFCDQLGNRIHVNPNITVANAFGLVLLGKESVAGQLMDELASRLDFNVGWQRTIADQVNLIKRKLNHSGDRARQQLEMWANETLDQIGTQLGNHVVAHDSLRNTLAQEQL